MESSVGAMTDDRASQVTRSDLAEPREAETSTAKSTSTVHRISLLAHRLSSISLTGSSSTSTSPGRVVSPTPVVPQLQTCRVSPVALSVFKGWGCSLGWWANYVGLSPHESMYCDLLFTDRTVSLFDQELPGLKLNIVRYNVGSCGRPGDVRNLLEKLPDVFPWYRRIEGFWVNWQNQDPDSESWDWTRDAAQRSILDHAIKRGVTNVELFSNAPVWWMTKQKSSAGGTLQSWNKKDWAVYLAIVAQQFISRYKVDVKSVSPINEPTSGYWKFPKNQEGCNLSRDQQRTIIAHLREELDARGLHHVVVAGPEENDPRTCADTWRDYKGKLARLDEAKRMSEKSVGAMLGKVNVHSYQGQSPNRDNRAREALRDAVNRAVPIAMSEYGDDEGSGLALATTILEDFHHLNPVSWCWWQPIEPSSSWGLVNAYCDATSEVAPKSRQELGKPMWVYTKLYVFAHFTRFIRPGYLILGTESSHDTVVGYDLAGRKLAIVCLTKPGESKIRKWEFAGYLKVGATQAKVMTTKLDHSVLWDDSTVAIDTKFSTLTLESVGGMIQSIVIEDIDL
ncbi:glycoside hydrolase superfamily [Cladochytrium replicatum]|nr:glycoside hydrolase superfamily [Cladochytrium replicatum]